MSSPLSPLGLDLRFVLRRGFLPSRPGDYTGSRDEGGVGSHHVCPVQGETWSLDTGTLTGRKGLGPSARSFSTLKEGRVLVVWGLESLPLSVHTPQSPLLSRTEEKKRE